MKRFTTYLLTGVLITGLLTGCGDVATNTEESSSSVPSQTVENSQEQVTDSKLDSVSYTVPISGVTHITLSDEGITVDGEAISTDNTSTVYAANDIVFYPEGQDFTFGEGAEGDTHSQAEADAHTVIHITQPGNYALSGQLSAGQIAVDLGEDAETDPNAVVNLYLNGVDITCSVAPGVIFYRVYECSSTDEETAQAQVDTSAAGANVILCDDTTNNVTGSYVARIYKSYTLSEDGTEVVDSKKLHKYDGAFYSKMSMNINGGNGTLNIEAENEGLDTELHLTINGGNINILSGNDGINTNEDNISVTTVNGGNLNIQVTGSTGEGDGIDSNGWLVINGGIVNAAACSSSGDAGIDSDMGIQINGGQVIASGNMLDRLDENSQAYAVFSFATRQKGGTTYALKDESEKIVGEWTPVNDYTYLLISNADLTPGTYTLWCEDVQMAASGGMGGFGGMGDGIPAGNFNPDQLPEDMELPEGMERPEGMELPEGMERPEGMELPEGMERPEGMKRPEGMERPENGEHPEGMERPNRGDSTDTLTLSTTFTLKEGANFFTNISASTES